MSPEEFIAVVVWFALAADLLAVVWFFVLEKPVGRFLCQHGWHHWRSGGRYGGGKYAYGCGQDGYDYRVKWWACRRENCDAQKIAKKHERLGPLRFVK